MHRTKWHLDPSSRLGTIDMGLKLGALPPFWRGELSPHLAQCGLGWGLPPYQVSSWSIQLFGHNRHGPKIGGSTSCPLFHTKWHLDLSSRLGTIEMGRKWEGYAPFWGGELGPHLAQCGLGRGLPPHQVASWFIQLFGHNWHGPKIGGIGPCPLSVEEGAWSPSNTMSLGSKPTSVPSVILIHRAIWLQQIWTKNVMGSCVPLRDGTWVPV